MREEKWIEGSREMSMLPSLVTMMKDAHKLFTATPRSSPPTNSDSAEVGIYQAKDSNALDRGGLRNACTLLSPALAEQVLCRANKRPVPTCCIHLASLPTSFRPSQPVHHPPKCRPRIRAAEHCKTGSEFEARQPRCRSCIQTVSIVPYCRESLLH